MNFFANFWHKNHEHAPEPAQTKEPALSDLIEQTKAALQEKRRRAENPQSTLHDLTAPPDLKAEPTILILPGNGATNDLFDKEKNQMMAGTASFAKAENYRQIPIAYASNTEVMKNGQNYREYHKQHQQPSTGWSRDTQDIMDKIIGPNIPDVRHQTGDERAENLIDCFDAFRNLKIFGNSYGGIMMREINNAVNADMAMKGYSMDERAFLMPNIMGMGVATVCHAESESKQTIPQMTSVHLKAMNDAFLNGGYEAFGPRENVMASHLSQMFPHGIIEFGPNQIGLYSEHEGIDRDIADNPWLKQRSHTIGTYIDLADRSAPEDQTPTQGAFTISHRAIWNAMTDSNAQNAEADITNQNISPTQKWYMLQEQHATPLNTIMTKAAQDPDFAQLLSQTTWHKPPPAISNNKAPEHAGFTNDINGAPDPVKLNREINYRLSIEKANFLLNAEFRQHSPSQYATIIPPEMANIEGVCDISDTSRVLFGTKDRSTYGNMQTSNAHEVVSLQYRGVTYPKYFMVDKDVYESVIHPFQQAWQNNTENEDIMSIHRNIHENRYKNTEPSAPPPASPSRGPSMR